LAAIDLPSRLLADTETSDTPTMMAPQPTHQDNSQRSAATLCMFSGGRSSAAGNDESNTAVGSRCTSKMDSVCSSVFSVSSFDSPPVQNSSPNTFSRSTGDLTCEAITNRLQSMSARLDSAASDFSRNEMFKDGFKDNFNDNFAT